MRTKINLDSIGKPLSTFVESKLVDAGLPSCLGDMAPPLISNEFDCDFFDIFVNADSVATESIVSDNVASIANSTEIAQETLNLNKYVLDI
jgi:hypothetical protein